MTKERNTQIFPTGREAGVNLHITSLPGDYGIGSIGGEARMFIDAMADMQLSVWQFLPLGPTAYGDSPYQPLSTFAGNEMLIGIDDLIADGLLLSEEASTLLSLPHDRVDYGTLIPLKTAVLHQVAAQFNARSNAAMKSAFKRFVADTDSDWLHDYALFRLLKQQHDHRPWPEWSSRYRQRDATALAKLASDCAAEIASVKIQQFLFSHQWQKLQAHARKSRIKLFGDLPIYIALDSADAWANRELLNVDEQGEPRSVAGVPPDYFSEDGQLWGNPLYDWDYHRQSGFQWWIQRVAAAAKQADLVRIDHFRGLESYWSVPAGSSTAKDGEWLPGPGDAFFDAIRNSLGALPIVAEDLGVITPEVETLRDSHQLPGMVVLQFKVNEPDFTLDQVPERCVCYTGTHDNDTTLGWFLGSPDEQRSAEEIHATQQAALAISGGDEATISLDLIKAALSTKARLCVAPMQDFLQLGSEARFNTPGVTGDNWQWRLQKEQLSTAFCDNIADVITHAARNPTHG